MLFSKETLKTFAQSKGLNNIEDEALRIFSQDLEYRLKELCQEAGKFMLAARRTKLSISDVNYALISRNVEPLFGYDSQETLVFRGLPCNIYYMPDEEIDLEEYLEKPLPKIPLKPYIQSHWLAIEGVQPPIQQNPVLIEKPQIKQDTLSIYQEELELKQQNKHLLTKELSMYYDKILQAIDTEPEIAVDCLLNETGIQQLVPYFLHHFKLEIRQNLDNNKRILTIIQMYSSILRNKFVFIDPYLHEVLPSILSCLIYKNSDEEIIDKSSDLIKFIYDTFGMKYRTVSPRIINFLKKVWLDDNKPENSQYGALKCLLMFPDKVIRHFVIPSIKDYKAGHPKVLNLINSIENKEDQQIESIHSKK